jgi:xylulose-5-phosphate/fructose-6-phosphate phosphoketolase
MHLSRLIQKYDQEMMFVLGPGHAFPALQANLFLEGTLGNYYPPAQQTPEGIAYICRNFSWPYGFPSHSNPGTPGVILEGGELGYSLSTSYGAVLDNP